MRERRRASAERGDFYARKARNMTQQREGINSPGNGARTNFLSPPPPPGKWPQIRTIHPSLDLSWLEARHSATFLIEIVWPSPQLLFHSTMMQAHLKKRERVNKKRPFSHHVWFMRVYCSMAVSRPYSFSLIHTHTVLGQPSSCLKRSEQQWAKTDFVP